MRAALCLLSLAVLAAGCSPKSDRTAGEAPGAATSAPSAMAKAERPRPQPGLWQNTMTMSGPRAMTVSSQICLDKAMADGGGWLNSARDGDAAGKPDPCTQSYEPSAAGLAFQSVCKFGERTVTSRGLATGDFNSAYTVDLTSTMDPPPAGAPSETKMTIAAKRIGDCAPGQAGGPVAGTMKMTPG